MLQFQFSEALQSKDIQKLQKKAMKNYPLFQEMTDYNVEIRVDAGKPLPRVAGQLKWYHLTTYDGVDQFLVHTDRITIVRKAPYISWENCYGRLVRDYDMCKSVLGFRKVSRLSVRYINRIDIPLRKDAKFDVSEYVNIFASAPGFGPDKINQGQVRFGSRDENTGVALLVTAGNVDPVLINHASYVLDIDAIYDQDIPLKRDEQLEKFSALRQMKNEVFELLVTDKARELFNV